MAEEAKLDVKEHNPKSSLVIQADGRVFVSVNDENRFIGEIHENTFVTLRDKDRHLMRKWNAYGINAELIDKVKQIENVVFEETSLEGTNYFTVSAEDIRCHGRYHKEEDFEAQYFIGLEHLKSI